MDQIELNGLSGFIAMNEVFFKVKQRNYNKKEEKMVAAHNGNSIKWHPAVCSGVNNINMPIISVY